LLALAEALHTHGYTKEACKLARQLAEEMLSAASSSDTCNTCVPVDHTTHHVKGIFSVKAHCLLVTAISALFDRD